MEEKAKRVYVCDGSVDGIFTAIYQAYDSHYGHRDIQIREVDGEETMELFHEYITVLSDSEKAEKVARTIEEKISSDAYSFVIKSALSKRKGRSDAIYRFIQLGLHVGPAVLDQLSHPYVLPLFEMERNVNFEVLHYEGFIRFSELKSGILVSQFRPENNILSLVAPHFDDRLPEENWLILDVSRKIAAVHRQGYPWIMVDGKEIDIEQLGDYSENEKQMQYFWQTFVDTIGIQERKNIGLQYQMLPNRYREFMREMPYRKQKSS